MPLTYYEIDRTAIATNIQNIRQHVGHDVLLCPVVKANAYGHGAVEVAKTVLKSGADRVAVNRVGEGVVLRQAGVTSPILVLGYTFQDDIESIIEYDLIPTITELEIARELANRVPKTHSIHVKVDTGMGRLGVLPHEAIAFIQQLALIPTLDVEGLFTHFSVADSQSSDDIAYTRQQFKTFETIVAQLDTLNIHIPIKHAANSAATMYYPETHLDMVRPGIIVYGLRPDRDVQPQFPLYPALMIKTHVGRVRELPSGSSISYGRTYITPTPTTVALIPIGYGDGYHRLLSNRAAVLIHGQRAPIVGRVCMDQFVVDISHIEGVKVDDEVVLLGKQRDAEITADELAEWAETINYEVTTSLLNRAPRIYHASRKSKSIAPSR